VTHTGPDETIASGGGHRSGPRREGAAGPRRPMLADTRVVDRPIPVPFRNAGRLFGGRADRVAESDRLG